MSEFPFSVGDSIEATQQVTSDLAAINLGSGSLQVYATPAMVRFIELTCRKLVEPQIPESQSTVGIDIRVQHLAPTPVGGEVKVRAEITEIDGNRIRFRAEVSDAEEKVGEADHWRAVIDVARFEKRVEKKRQALGG